MTIPQTQWTPARLKLVQKLIDEGVHNYKSIGEILGVSKNAIVAVVNRHITLRDKKEKIIMETVQQPASTRQHGALSINFRKKYTKAWKPEMDVAGTIAWPTDGYCLNIKGEPKAMRSCAGKRMEGSSYCKDCSGLMFVAHVRRRRKYKS
jgi:hypothetical protein